MTSISSDLKQGEELLTLQLTYMKSLIRTLHRLIYDIEIPSDLSPEEAAKLYTPKVNDQTVEKFEVSALLLSFLTSD